MTLLLSLVTVVTTLQLTLAKRTRRSARTQDVIVAIVCNDKSTNAVDGKFCRKSELAGTRKWEVIENNAIHFKSR